MTASDPNLEKETIRAFEDETCLLRISGTFPAGSLTWRLASRNSGPLSVGAWEVLVNRLFSQRRRKLCDSQLVREAISRLRVARRAKAQPKTATL